MNVNDQSALKTVFVLLAILSCRFSLVFAQEKSNQPTDSNAQSSTQKVFKVDPSSESQQLADHPLQVLLELCQALRAPGPRLWIPGLGDWNPGPRAPAD